jgi:ankyrin repeat protein
MKRIALVCSALLVSGSVAAFAQDTRATALRAPASRAPVVAEAASKGDLAAVKKLIQQGADVNVAQGDGMTALHWAAERGDAAMTDALLQARANVKATTRIGSYTPLHIASKSASAPIVKALLKAGADANAATTSGATPLHLAAAAGSGDVVTALVASGAKPNTPEAEWGQTPLIFASEYDRPDAVKALLKAGADPKVRSTAMNLNEQTARDQAAARKRGEVLFSFLPKNIQDSMKAVRVKDSIANANAATTGGAFGQGGGAGRPGAGRGATQLIPQGWQFTPSQLAAAIDSGRAVLSQAAAGKGPVTEEVDTLNGGVAGFLGSVGGVGGLTPLHHAVRQGSIDAAIALIEGGADINDQTPVDHTTPLLMATINGQFDVAMKLIERGADPNIASTTGITPLYATINIQWAPKSRYPQPQAIQHQKTTYLEVMEALLKAKANPNVRLSGQPWYFAYNNCGNANCGLENIEGTTPFWRAAYGLDVEAMKLLVKYGADPKIPAQRSAQGGGGRGGRGRGGAAGVPMDSAQAALLARRGGGGGGGEGRGGPPRALPPDIDSAAKAVPPGIGVFPIHAASGVGYGTGFAGNSHRHAPDGWLPSVKYMVEELGADVNQRDSGGFTPLHHAAARGDNEMIQYLVSKGADVKAVSRNGMTTLDMANGPVSRVSPIPSTMALLEKLGAKNTHRCVSC